MLEKPLLVYDGDCGFCRRWVSRWRSRTGDRIAYASYQEVGGQYPEIGLERFRASVQLLDTDGAVYEGAEAVFRTLACSSSLRWPLWLYQNLPGFAPVAEWSYRFTAVRRKNF